MTSLLHPDAELWPQNHSPRPLKVSVIREELVALTGDPLIAVVLNQLLYWTQRVKDFDQLLEEEIKRNPECNVPLRHGWIYKSSADLSEETMLHTSCSTMRRYISVLVSKKWIEERDNPQDKWKKTKQYRLNLRKIQADLLVLGYSLPGFSLPFYKDGQPIQNIRELTTTNHRTPTFQNDPLNRQNETSEVQNEKTYTYTEITPETKNREHTARARNENCFLSEELACFENSETLTASAVSDSHLQLDIHPILSESLSHKALELWKIHIGQEVYFTESRGLGLSRVLEAYFQNDVLEWQRFCERVKSSSFLMGQGPNKWHVSLDWILIPSNLLKVLEGNYDNPDILEQKQKNGNQQKRDLEVRKILDSIEDEQWKYWCTQLSRSFSQKDNPPHKETFANDSLSLGDLKEIAQAKFLEFDGRLVWIESSDPKTLNRIEDLRLLILPVIRHTYPQARNLRAQREERGRGKTGALSPIHVDADKTNVLPPQIFEKENLSSHFPYGQEQEHPCQGQKLTFQHSSVSHFNLNKGEAHAE